jgi:hypothetical protein
MEMTADQACEAIKLLRALASYSCENENDSESCVVLNRDRASTCAPCHAWMLLEDLEDQALKGQVRPCGPGFDSIDSVTVRCGKHCGTPCGKRKALCLRGCWAPRVGAW